MHWPSVLFPPSSFLTKETRGALKSWVSEIGEQSRDLRARGYLCFGFVIFWCKLNFLLFPFVCVGVRDFVASFLC